MNATAAIGALAALLVGAVVASAQPGFQPPPDLFQTPSGNVQCLLGRGTLRCTVLEHDYPTPPAAAACRPPWNGQLALGRQGQAQLPCTAALVRDDDAFVLGYGARWLGPGITCESDESGLKCTNAAGHGFRASRSTLELF
ncbi:DUF6636 domain-containing protein [Roseomonas sp. AR75]|uniref:DUF6636 domain-containing protein n=1 Tax=Roseomonas sp. AR75 TaxID=2562311 RepID=UPI0010C05E11|nr:DUF6636 domain-containing protein [Roseomonas sp. AR75]